jgi:putative molybdopterin biosynthesis protein
MSVYLHDIPLPEAKVQLESTLRTLGLWQVLGVETIPLDEDALGRTLAAAIWAKTSSPHYHASAMDGFAVRAADTIGAGPSTPVVLDAGKQARYVDTGDPLPPGFDAVIPIENTEAVDEDGSISSSIRNPKAIRLRATVPPWSHVRPLGEDIVATELVLPEGHVLRPVDLGAIAAAGLAEIQVARRPRVAILPTGSELVPIGTRAKPGEILEYNSLVMAAQILGMGGQATRFPVVPDDFEAICEQVSSAAQNHDLILLNAGSSAGAEDFSASVVKKLGSLLVHGVAVRPGHPVILGLIKREVSEGPANNIISIPIIGVPGYPVSAALTVEIFVEELLARWLGRTVREQPEISAKLTRKIVSPAGDDDYVRVAVGKVDGKVLAAPLSRGAGVITSLVRADGLMVLPSGKQGAEAGEEVQVRLYRAYGEIDRTIMSIGSHDLTLDLMAQYLAGYERRLVSANVGSLAGLVALRRGEAHLSGSHLLDPETGEFNVSYIREYLPDTPVKVIALVGRQQGLIVPAGNPKKISSLEDLARPDIGFVNRQRGAGTRVLLDFHINLKGIATGGIIGYNQEEYTHLGVAAAIASGRADCGLGIMAAANALELDFIPLFQERYDLVMPKRFAQDDLVAPVFELLENRAFRKAVAALPGYDVSIMGNMIVED